MSPVFWLLETLLVIMSTCYNLMRNATRREGKIMPRRAALLLATIGACSGFTFALLTSACALDVHTPHISTPTPHITAPKANAPNLTAHTTRSGNARFSEAPTAPAAIGSQLQTANRIIASRPQTPWDRQKAERACHGLRSCRVRFASAVRSKKHSCETAYPLAFNHTTQNKIVTCAEKDPDSKQRD